MSRNTFTPNRPEQYISGERAHVGRHSEARGLTNKERIRKEREHEEKRKRLEREFIEIDRDNSGFVTQDELYDFLDRKASLLSRLNKAYPQQF